MDTVCLGFLIRSVVFGRIFADSVDATFNLDFEFKMLLFLPRVLVDPLNPRNFFQMFIYINYQF